MKWTLPLVSLAAAAISVSTGCNSEAAVPVVEQHAAGEVAHSVAKLEIEGMMCAVACGGKISKELIEVQGVANAEIDFDPDREVNYAEVEFDPNRVAPELLAATVGDIAGGALYKVHGVEVTHYAEAATGLATE